MTTRELLKKMFMIKIENISRSFGVVETVKKPSFEVKAVEVFKYYVESRPEEPEAHYYLGGAYYRLNKYDLARACFEKTLKIDSTHRPAAQLLERMDSEGCYLSIPITERESISIGEQLADKNSFILWS